MNGKFTINVRQLFYSAKSALNFALSYFSVKQTKVFCLMVNISLLQRIVIMLNL